MEKAEIRSRISFELSAEAKSALRRKPIKLERLVSMLNDTDENTMPTSEEARQLVAEVLTRRGYKLTSN